jgi:hypothetical protein
MSAVIAAIDSASRVLILSGCLSELLADMRPGVLELFGHMLELRGLTRMTLP